MVAPVDSPPSVEVRGPMAQALYLPIMERRWEDIPKELCFWGGAGTGKSYTLMLILVLLMTDEEIGGLRILWCRKTRKSITNSSIVTYAKVLNALGMKMSSKPQPSQRQQETFETKAGTNTLVWMSLEDPLNAFSAEYDIVVTEEGIQVSESTYEMAGGRCLRNFAIPKQFLIVLTNPGPKVGWIYRRMFVTKRMESFRTVLFDNPAYFNLETQELTAMGRGYLDSLKHTYTDPTRYARMVKGEFCSEEGWILEGVYDEDRHTFNGEWVDAKYGKPRLTVFDHPILETEIELEWTFGSMDLGFVNAATLQVWGVDALGRMFLIEEVYRSQTDRDVWAEEIIRCTEKYHLQCVVADHAPEVQLHWNQTLQERLPETANTWDGQAFIRNCEKSRGNKDSLKVDVVRTVLNNGPDGTPRCYLRANSLAGQADPVLEAKSLPTCLHEEIPNLVWAPLPDDKADDRLPEEKIKDGRPNHGFDAWVYAGRFVQGRDIGPDWEADKPEHHPGTFEHHMDIMEKKWAQQ